MVRSSTGSLATSPFSILFNLLLFFMIGCSSDSNLNAVSTQKNARSSADSTSAIDSSKESGAMDSSNDEGEDEIVAVPPSVVSGSYLSCHFAKSHSALSCRLKDSNDQTIPPEQIDLKASIEIDGHSQELNASSTDHSSGLITFSLPGIDSSVHLKFSIAEAEPENLPSMEESQEALFEISGEELASQSESATITISQSHDEKLGDPTNEDNSAIPSEDEFSHDSQEGDLNDDSSSTVAAHDEDDETSDETSSSQEEDDRDDPALSPPVSSPPPPSFDGEDEKEESLTHSNLEKNSEGYYRIVLLENEGERAKSLRDIEHATLLEVIDEINVGDEILAPFVLELISSSSLDHESVQNAALVIWMDHSTPLDSLDDGIVSFLAGVYSAGVPLYLMGDDLAYSMDYNLTRSAQNIFSELSHIQPSLSKDVQGGEINVKNADHTILNGPFGYATDFSYPLDPSLDVQVTGTGETVLASSSIDGSAMLVAFEGDRETPPVVTQLFMTAAGYLPASSQSSEMESEAARDYRTRRVIFKNALYWLLGEIHQREQ